MEHEKTISSTVVLFDHLSLLRQRLEEPSEVLCLAWNPRTPELTPSPDGRSLVPDKRKRS